MYKYTSKNFIFNIKQSMVFKKGQTNGGVGNLIIPIHLRELAEKYRAKKMICRKCDSRLPLNAHNCRNKKCGHCGDIRMMKRFTEPKNGK